MLHTTIFVAEVGGRHCGLEKKKGFAPQTTVRLSRVGRGSTNSSNPTLPRQISPISAGAGGGGEAESSLIVLQSWSPAASQNGTCSQAVSGAI
jgi:hypothetical protein